MLGFDWKKGLSRFVGASLAVVVLTVVGAVSPAHAAATTVLSVTSTTPDGSYKLGSAIIPIQVTFSAPVVVTGFPTLELETGVTDRLATYFSGSGSATRLLRWYVMPALP